MWEKKQIFKVIQYFIENVLIQRDVEKAMEAVSENILGVGMSEQGTVSCKEELRQILSETNIIPGAEYRVEYPREDIRYYPPGFAAASVVYEVICRTEKETTKSAFIQTASLVKEGENWKICLLQAIPVDLNKDSMSNYPLKFAEETLRKLKSELQTATFHLMNESISGGILGCYLNKDNAEYPLYFVNDSMLSYLDYTREEFEEKYKANVWNVIYQEDYEALQFEIFHALENNKAFQLQHRVEKKDGSILWMVIRGQQGVDEYGNQVLIGVFVDVTEMIMLQEQLREQKEALAVSEERFRIALEKTSNIIFDYDIISGNIVHASIPKKPIEFVTNIRAIKKELVLGGEIEDESMQQLEEMFRKVQQGENHCSCEVKVKLLAGNMIWSRITLNGITDDNGKIVRAIGMIEDITRQKEAELAYAQEEQYRQVMLADVLASYIINLSKNQFESSRVRHPFCIDILPGEAYDTTIERIAKMRFSINDRQRYLDKFSKAKLLEQYEKGVTEFSLDYCVWNANSADMWMKTTLRVIPDRTNNDIKGFMYVTDIDKQKREELELLHRSEEDSMTGTLNKGTVIRLIEERLQTYEGIQGGVFFMLDIDYFKKINDTYGHPFGDDVLIQVTQILQETARRDDLVGRLGGDEFCTFFCGMNSKRQVKRTAQAICESIQKIKLPEKNKKLTCSIGIVICDEELHTFNDLYQKADLALYQVKKNGRNGYRIA